MEVFEVLFFYLSLFLYLFANIYGFFVYFFKKEFYFKIIYKITLLAFIFHFLTIVFRSLISKHIPVIGNYENILMGSFFLIIIILLFFKKEKLILPFLFSLSLNIILFGMAIFADAEKKPLFAALKSFWLYIHIIFAWLSYGAFTVAAGVSIAYLIKKEKPLEEIIFKLSAFGLVMDALMIIAGSIWAKDLWGSYWSWDPVETWSLISFLLYGLILHLKITLKIRGKTFAYFIIFSLITVLISFWGVNFFMGKSLHIFNVG